MGETSAKEMVQGLANCQGPLQHRGSMAFAKNPRDNRFLFPGLPPTGGTPQTYVPPSIINRQPLINIPPWQNVPWEPIPYPEQEQWQPIPYPEWPAGQYPWDDTSVVVNGPTYMGDVTTNNIDSRTVNSQNIVNEGDIVNRNQFFQGGPMINEGPVIHNHNVVNRFNVVNNRTVNNEGPVFNNNVTHNRVSHNYDTHNHNTTNHYGETYLTLVYSSGPNVFAGDTSIGDSSTTDVTIEGDEITLIGQVFIQSPGGGAGEGPYGSVSLNVLTDVDWDSGALTLKKTYRNISLIGSLGAAQEETILTGTSCPSTPLNASAGNYADMP